jgi:hypothetical protein
MRFTTASIGGASIGGEQMKVYKTIESGREIHRFLPIPREFLDYELEIVIKPIKKKEGSIFSEFLKDKIEIHEYKKIPREELNER